MLQTTLGYNESHIMLAQTIREDVFIKEQNVPENIELDGLDPYCRHIIALFNYEPVGCGRMQIIENKIKLGRIAVLKNFRGKGIGKEIINFAFNYAINENIDEIFMHAQTYLLEYYQNFGFSPDGNEFIEANIPHIFMFKKFI